MVVRKAVLGVSVAMPHPQRYYSRKPRGWGRNAKLELILTIIVIVAVIATLVIFLAIYHDLPFRTGEPSVVVG